MKESVLKEIKKMNQEILKLHKKLELNEGILDKLKQDEKVLEAINLLLKCQELQSGINNIKNDINRLINNKCSHNLLLYREYNIEMYDSYYEYQCLECGKVTESTYKLNNVIFSDVSYEILKKDYYKYLLEYDEKIAIEMMLIKYSKKLFNDLINNGLSEIDALKLVKRYEREE